MRIHDCFIHNPYLSIGDSRVYIIHPQGPDTAMLVWQGNVLMKYLNYIKKNGEKQLLFADFEG